MKCPCCGYEEPFYWHYPTFRGLEMPYARIEEIENETPELAKKLKTGTLIRKGQLEYVDENYAYKYSVESGFVRRRELALWKAFKWEGAPMEKHILVDPRQKKLLEVCQKSQG